jgi:hypothetical protein
MFLTMLELDLYFEVLSEQVHHHSLHVTTDATAVPGHRDNMDMVWHRENLCEHSMCIYQQFKSLKLRAGLTSAPAVQCSECS